MERGDENDGRAPVEIRSDDRFPLAEILRKLSRLCELSQGFRVGQLMAHLGFLAEDMFDKGVAELEDDQLLRVLERHEGELARRQSNVA